MAYDGSLKFDTSMDTAGFQKGANSLGNIVKGLGVFKLIEKGMQIVAGSIDSAVSRVDTLNKFPRVMEQMGYGADAAKQSIAKLSDGIQGLPTTLDGIVGSAQRLTLATSDLGKGTDSALALNNALLASGASAEAASRGTEQYIQALSRGKIDTIEWRTLMETMPYAMQELANAFGFTGAGGVQSLQAAMSSGEITMLQFNDKLIELNGSVGGFAALAQTASGGIATAWRNIQTAVARGVANVIQAVDDGLVSFGGIPGVLSGVKSAVDSSFTAIAGVARLLMENLDLLLPVVLSVGAAFAAYSIIGTVTGAMKKLQATVAAANAVLQLNTMSMMKDAAAHTVLAAALAGETTAQAVRTAAKAAGMSIDAAGNILTAKGTAATQKETLAILASSGALGVKTLAVGLLTGGISLASAAQLVWNAAMQANPIGTVVAVVTVLAGGLISLAKWLGKVTGGTQDYTAEVKNITNAQKEFAGASQESAQAFAANTAAVAAQGKVQRALAKDLSAVQHSTLGTAEKQKKMKSIVQQLNSSVEGLNLAYDEETGSLRNLNTNQEISLAQVEQLVDAKAQLAEANAWQERANELSKEQVKAQEELALIEAKRSEIERNSIPHDAKARQMHQLKQAEKEYLAAMEDTEQRLAIVNENIAASNTEAAQSVVADYARMEEAVTSGGEGIAQVAARWGVSVEEMKAAWMNAGGSFDAFVATQDSALNRAQEAVEEYTGIVTNGFSEMQQKSAVSLDEFLENMRKNQEATANWAQNMNTLMALGVHEGVIAQLAQMGPEGAVQAQVFVDELQSMNGETALALGDTSETVRAKLAEMNTVFNTGLDAAKAAAQTQLQAQSYYEAGYTAVDNIGLGFAQNPTAVQAATQAGVGIAQGTVNAFNTVDFAAAGQTAGAGLTAGLSSSVTAGAGAVNTAISGMGAGVQTAVQGMAAGAQAASAQMMAQMGEAVTAGGAALTAGVTACTQGVATLFETLKATTVTTVTAMMSEAQTALAAGAQTVLGTVTALCAGVLTAFEGMAQGAVAATGSMMDSMAAVMAAKAEGLYAQARTIAASISAALTAAFNVQAPSAVAPRAVRSGRSASPVPGARAVSDALQTRSSFLYRAPEPAANAGDIPLARAMNAAPDTTAQLHTALRMTTQDLQHRMAANAGAPRTVYTPQSRPQKEVKDAVKQALTGVQLRGRVELPVELALDGRTLYKGMKEVEASFGYDVGGMAYAW